MITKTLQELLVENIAIESNVGISRRANDALIASVAEHGVIQPITVYIREGVPVLLAGHCRLDAAKKNGHDMIPAVVYDGDISDAKLRAMQIVENTRRVDLSPLEQFEAYQQVLDLVGDLEAAELLSEPLPVVEGVRAVMHSKQAQEALAEVRGLDLFQAAIIAELEADPVIPEEMVINALDKIEKEPAKVSHIMANLTDDAECTREWLNTAARLSDEGYSILKLTAGETYPYEYQNGKPGFIPLSGLAYKGDVLTAAEHANCGGRAVIVVKPGRAGVEARLIYGCADPEIWGHEYLSEAQESQKKSKRAALIGQAKKDDEEAFRRAAAVRNEYVRNLLARKQMPAGYLQFALEGATESSHEDEKVSELFFDGNLFEHYCVSENRLARFLAARHIFKRTADIFHIFSWHSEDTQDEAREVIDWLAGTGYELSWIEQKVVDGEYVFPTEREWPELEDE